MSTLISFDEHGRIVGRTTAPASMVEAAAAESDFAIVANGILATEETHYVEDGALVEKPEKPSEEYIFNYSTKQWAYDLTGHRQNKWAEIKSERNREEFSTFEWNSHTFQCDERSQSRIMSAVQRAQLDSTLTMVWTLSDNSTVTLNATELKQVGQALASHIDACHVKARGLRTQINAAETEAELDLITW